MGGRTVSVVVVAGLHGDGGRQIQRRCGDGTWQHIRRISDQDRRAPLSSYIRAGSPGDDEELDAPPAAGERQGELARRVHVVVVVGTSRNDTATPDNGIAGAIIHTADKLVGALHGPRHGKAMV